MKETEQRKIFDKWLAEHKALWFKVIRSYTSDPEDQEDLFQDICLQVYRSIPNFLGNAAVTTWIYRIALNTAIKWLSKRKKDEDRQADHHVLANVGEPRDERVDWLYDQIKTLNEIDRSLALLLLEGYSYKEMAHILGISESSVGVKIHRIKKQLIENSKEYDYGI